MKDAIIVKRRWMRWGFIFGFWTLLGVFFGIQLYLVNALEYRHPIPWQQAIFWALLDWYIWGAFSPLVLSLARLFHLSRESWAQDLRVHLPACVILALSHPLLLAAVTQFFGQVSNPSVTFFERFQGAFAIKFHWNLVTYWVIVGVSLALDYYRKYRERELAAAQLEARLAQAQLEALKMQLHPHFLFNTLHAISALMYSDLAAADRMLARLSELLRLTLRNIGAQEVTLKQELEFLEHYLEIEQARFADRLTVQMEIDPATLDAQVPNLLLQPLVENAIRYGIAPREEAGRIEIHARRTNGMLELQVRDDGPGLPDSEEIKLKEGIGLANTRARLRQLHGVAQCFELRNAAEGGLVVSVTLPFKTQADEIERSKL
jgi:signal transduction histidine kinase